MTYISYAQNYEDVMLRRALKSVKKGFYVDVGAEHPVNDSVTKAFHLEGWSGINIEPVPTWYRMLCEDRPGDTNLNIAVGNEPGTLTLYSVEGTGLSTAESRFVERYQEEGKNVSVLEVPVRTLTDVLGEYAPGTIHFLKVDVEGFERQVLEGLDLDHYRPWILVIESTLPNSTEERYADWEPLVAGNGYRFAYFDGLNRFYVADEKVDLLDAFKAPPNHFDAFIRRSEWECRQRMAEFETKAAISDERLITTQSALAATRRTVELTRARLSEREQAFQRIEAEHRARQARLEDEVQRLRNALEMVHASTSWKVTASLRFLATNLRRLPQRVAEIRALRWCITILLKPFPALKQRVTRMFFGVPVEREPLSMIADRESGAAAREFVERLDEARAARRRER